MILDVNWVNNGVKKLENIENAAGVTGVMYSYMPGQKIGEGRLIQFPFGEVSFLPGAAMYKRNVLEEVGHFNPFMKGAFAISDRTEIQKTICFFFDRISARRQ